MYDVRKDPNEDIQYGLDWTEWLEGDIIVSSEWTATGLTASNPANDTTSTTVWLAGGVVGQQYNARNLITSGNGRIGERTIVVHVMLR